MARPLRGGTGDLLMLDIKHRAIQPDALDAVPRIPLADFAAIGVSAARANRDPAALGQEDGQRAGTLAMEITMMWGNVSYGHVVAYEIRFAGHPGP